MNGHILYPGVTQRSERLFVYGQFLQFIQWFQAVDNPACWSERDVSWQSKINWGHLCQSTESKNCIANLTYNCISLLHDHTPILWFTYFPNTVYFMSRWGCLAYVKKNWEPFMLGPLFAIETTPLTLCWNRRKQTVSHDEICKYNLGHRVRWCTHF